MGIRLSGEIVRRLRKMNVILLVRFGVDLALELVFALELAHLDLAQVHRARSRITKGSTRTLNTLTADALDELKSTAKIRGNVVSVDLEDISSHLNETNLTIISKHSIKHHQPRIRMVTKGISRPISCAESSCGIQFPIVQSVVALQPKHSQVKILPRLKLINDVCGQVVGCRKLKQHFDWEGAERANQRTERK